MKNYKDFAIDLAKKAGYIMQTNFSLGMKKKWKSDNSPLTVSDTTINSLVIDQVKKTYPDFGVLGEEQSINISNDKLWVCDPIDGTIPFSHGYPIFVFSLALVVNGESKLGVIYDPIMDRMIYAEKGKGAYLNNAHIQVSSFNTIKEKMIVNIETSNIESKIRKPLMKKGSICTTYCCASYASMQVATGELVGNIFENTKPWDAAAAKIIVEEAGGKFTDLHGNEQRYDRKINGFIASNGLVHEELVSICTINNSK